MTLGQFEEFWDDMRDGFYIFALGAVLFGLEHTAFGRLLDFLAYMFGWAIFSAIKQYWKGRKSNG